MGRGNCGGYNELLFDVFAWGYLLVLLGLYSSSLSLSLSTGAGTDEEIEEDGAGVQGAIGDDGGGWRRYQVRYVDDHHRRGCQK